MDGLGVDENIAQGSGGSDPEGHESFSSEEDVFERKKEDSEEAHGFELPNTACV